MNTLPSVKALTDPEAPPEMREIADEVLAAMEHLVTEDDTPVDNIYSEKQQRLLTEPLHESAARWRSSGSGRFLALANVGLFYALNEPPLVPDMMLALDVPGVGEDLRLKVNRSYFTWMQGKPPDVVIEVVSNREGGELDRKLERYARIGVRYYVVHDPFQLLGERVLRIFQLHGGAYLEQAGGVLEGIGLSLKLWRGEFEGVSEEWLRWCDGEGRPIPTGGEAAEQERERAEQERERAEQERERAEQERERAEQERERAERLAARLRAAGIDPDQA